MQPFGRFLLAKGVAEETRAATVVPANEDELDSYFFGADGDRELVDSILVFSRTLLENCGNRSLYNSSDRLGDILNTSDLSLLASTLHLAVRLAQRYHASRQRGANASQNLNNALLASHYSIDLEKVQKLANPFVKSLPSSSADLDFSATPATTPTAKGKEKAHVAHPSSVHASDMLAMARDDGAMTNGKAEHAEKGERGGHGTWEDWGGVLLRYYQTPGLSKDEKKPNASSAIPTAPVTPAPIRRTSTLSRQSRLSTSDETPTVSPVAPIVKPDDSTSGGMKLVEIPYAKVSSTPVNELVKSALPRIPKEYHYDLLSKVRIAHALSASLSTRQEMLGIRLLAITNLAYIYPEATFQQKILQQDSDEPRRLQLAYQLTDLIHPPGNRGVVPTRLQTLALSTLEAFAKNKAKALDVCAALNINVNHGVLFYALRKAVADLTIEDPETDGLDMDEWRAALFSLLDALPNSSPRAGETLLAAGLLDILIDILTLKTDKAERCYPAVLAFLNTIIYTVRDAFQTLANSKGLDTISDLISYEVQLSLERARDGDGLPQNFRNQVIDYQIPFFQQQTLRWLFKFVNHMMSHGNGNFDRLLRNLIDSAQLLSGLQTVIVNAKVFGSSVWSGAVNIMSSFIHNEPTSYAVIAEAGLSKGLLEAITSEPVKDSGSPNSEAQRLVSLQSRLMSHETDEDTEQARSRAQQIEARLQRSEDNILAQGILPATDAIVTIPQAFGAICLNNIGMDLFLKSNALDKFFEIFESSDHVRSMNVEGELARLLGSSFDELVRHHPRLRQSVMVSVMAMVSRVGDLCASRATNKGFGAKLWLEGKNGEPIDSADVAATYAPETGGSLSNVLAPSSEADGDVVMAEASSSNEPSLTESRRPSNRSSKLEGAGDKEDEKNGPCTATYINVAMKFLAGFFENSSLCSVFIELGGIEFVLNFATLPSLQYDFNNQAASSEISRVIHMLAEQKPHLVLPSLVRRTQDAADDLDVLSNHIDGTAFFAEFTSTEHSVSNVSDIVSKEKSGPSGTKLVKSLVSVHTLCNILYETFSQPIYNSRSSQTVFSQVNLADMYDALVRSLGRLHRACVWEEILLQKSIPDSWKEATRTKGYAMRGEEADELFGFISRDESRDEISPETSESTADVVSQGSSTQSRTLIASSTPKKARKASLSKDEKSAQFRNIRTLKYLLSQIPSSIIPLFQGLGKALIAKRRPEAYAKQNAYMVAVAISEANLEQLRFEAPRNAPSGKDRYAYWIVILTSISQLMIEGMNGLCSFSNSANCAAAGPLERPQSQCLTLVLQAFKDNGGLNAIKTLLESFFEEVKSFSNPANDMADVSEGAARLTSAYGGIKIILNFFTQIITSSSITEASQTLALASNDRNRENPHFFSPSQFLVELRMAVLPVVRSIWDSDFVDKASGSIVKCLIEILRIVLDGSDEQGAFKRGDKVPARSHAPLKTYSVHNDKLATLTEKWHDDTLAREALYRCMNVQVAADEYCKAYSQFKRIPRNPIPAYDQEKPKTPSPVLTPHRQDSEATIPDLEDIGDSGDSVRDPLFPLLEESLGQRSIDAHVEVEEDVEDTRSISVPPPRLAPGVPVEADDSERDGTDGIGMSIDNLLNLNQMPQANQTASLAPTRSANVSPSPTEPVEVAKLPEAVTINDLDEERTAIRRNLIDRSLDVLNIHDDVTFELADLINAASLNAGDSATMRREIGQTLVHALISFQMDDDFRHAGKKIAANAHLLALVLQERDFYEATLEELKSNFLCLLGYIKIFPDQTAEEASPWIGQILLIVEKILAEDVQPSQIQWTSPNLEGSRPDSPIAELQASLLPLDEKLKLFDAIVEILPRIGKDESLALSVIRTLVILTRNREIADKLSERRNIQRLFVMVKQLAGITNDRVQGAFMILLRHIVEDDDTIRQIMRSEIIANFEIRTGRATDTTGYVRQMYHLVLRSPTIFVEITNEKLEIQKYDASQRPQGLMLKPEIREPGDSQASEGASESAIDHAKLNDQNKNEEIAINPDDGKNVSPKPKSTEIRPPVLEHPSGVIHYLLNELLVYKEAVDKEHPLPAKDLAEEVPSAPAVDSSTINGSGVRASTPSISAEANESKKVEKPEFKAEQHPIYIYRCFILQCLAELLHCYNRTKIEFITFSRKADPKAVTPAKPRSGVLNYLLNEVIPVGTLNHDESISHRKKSNTSNWAISAIVSLCLRTNERGYEKKRGSVDEEDESDLLFVRKLVLEHALKAFKDANTSEESLDVRYSRLLCIADLFNRILLGKLVPSAATHPTDTTSSQKALAKLMFEKNFISALTASIADIDLNFPGSKRAVKYILRPLKLLTSTAIVLSETSDLSGAPGQTDDDEISTATSVSEEDGEREETPDLFRNSTLGMFEPGREEVSSTDSSEEDEEMYDDDEYEDDGMEYAEGLERDDDEVISDEEEIEGVGHLEGMPGDTGMDVEVVIDEADDDDPSDGDDPDDSDDMDDDAEVELVDEITGDSENDSLAEGEEEWQDEDEDREHYAEGDGLEGDPGHHQDHVREMVREFTGAASPFQRLEGAELAMDIGEDNEYLGAVIQNDDDDGKQWITTI